MPKNRNVANLQDEQWGSRYDHNLWFEHIYGLFVSIYHTIIQYLIWYVVIYFNVNEFTQEENSKFLVIWLIDSTTYVIGIYLINEIFNLIKLHLSLFPTIICCWYPIVCYLFRGGYIDLRMICCPERVANDATNGLSTHVFVNIAQI